MMMSSWSYIIIKMACFPNNIWTRFHMLYHWTPAIHVIASSTHPSSFKLIPISQLLKLLHECYYHIFFLYRTMLRQEIRRQLKLLRKRKRVRCVWTASGGCPFFNILRKGLQNCFCCFRMIHMWANSMWFWLGAFVVLTTKHLSIQQGPVSGRTFCSVCHHKYFRTVNKAAV